MLINMKNMLDKAALSNYAVPHFNINNLEWAKYILEECQELKTPLILGVSEGAVKYMGGYNVVYGMILGLLKDLNISIPVALHLDHGSSFNECKKAIDAGFTSVMIDASKLTLYENINITNQVIDYAKKFNVTVEAEIGCIGSSNDLDIEKKYADINDCEDLVKNCDICCLAPAIGSVHGLYKSTPNLNFELLNKIKNITKIPLVLHGGTGIYDEQIKKAIENGISKINVNTELQVNWYKSVKKFVNQNDIYDPRKVIGSGESDLKKIVREKVMLFGSNNKA